MRSTLKASSCTVVMLLALAACMQVEKKPSPAAMGVQGRPPESTADRIYSDGALADPEPQAADLGMAGPDSKITIDTEKDSQATR